MILINSKNIIMKKFKKWLMNDIASLEILPSKIRIMILNVCGAKVMASRILPKCYFAGTKLQIGKGTTVNFFNKFDSEYASIIIGENVGIGMNNLFLTTSHKMGGQDKRVGDTIHASIVIEDNSWIGSNTVICPGVTIGKGCVIASGSVVIESCQSNGFYAGVPAKLIRIIE